MTAIVASAWRQYLCRVCGLVYDERLGDTDSGLAAGTRFEDIPEDWACPICGVGKADFELHVQAPAVALRRTARPGVQRRPGVVIVGAGRAGWQVAQALRAAGHAGAIAIISACPGDVYDKPMLSVAVARGLDLGGLVRERADAAAARLQVQLLSGTQVVAIDADTRRLRSTRGSLRYSHLVLAHGAEPVLPAALPPALVWRVNDLVAYRRLRDVLAAGPQRLAIVGAGLVGCELANDLALAGHCITLLDMQPRPLAAQLPAPASERLLAAWKDLPIVFEGGVQVSSIERLVDLQGTQGTQPNQPTQATQITHATHADQGALAVRLRDGRCITVDQVIAATGLRTAGRLARSAGLAFDDAAGGIRVQAETGATSRDGIYALGDCAVVAGVASRFIEPIAGQAQAIASHIRGAAFTAVAAAPPVLRIKTSALPITVRGWRGNASALVIERQDDKGLLLRAG